MALNPWSIGLLALLILYSNPKLSLTPRRHFILWDVGQGQWLTWFSGQKCIHFDMGGEHMNWSSLRRLCRNKPNLLLLSHADWDHINLMWKAKRQLPGICLMKLPLEPLTGKKRRYLKYFPRCKVATPPQIDEVFSPHKLSQANVHNNALSRVYLLAQSLLIPGDSPSKQEKVWLHNIFNKKKVRWLVLGHHGSRTSSSNKLLSELPRLRLGLASARKSRYGHPHKIIEGRFRKKGVPLITTQNWGDIHIYY